MRGRQNAGGVSRGSGGGGELEIWVCEMAFPTFWRQFWPKSKRLNRICNSTFYQMHII